MWRFPLFLITVLNCAVVQAQVEDQPLQLLPASIAQGADIQALVASGPANASLQVVLIVDGFRQQLATLTTDSQGRGAVTTPLPASTPVGTWDMELSTLGGVALVVLDTDPMTVTPGPQVAVTPGDGYGGQWVDFTVTGLTPGTVDVRVDGFLVYGPQAVADDSLAGRFRMPNGSGGPVDVVLESRVGSRLVGIGVGAFKRLVRNISRPTVSQVAMPATVVRDTMFEITGQVQVPEGSAVTDFSWSLAWLTEDLKPVQYPVNIPPFDFDAMTRSNRTGQPVSFTVQATAPSLSRGFPLADISQKDDLGFVYTNPDTGESGVVIVATAIGGELADYEGITISGRLVDDTGAPLAGGIWTVEAQTQLVEPDVAPEASAQKVAGSGVTNSAAALIHGNNQLSAATTTLLPGYTPSGCPITLSNGVTDDNGDYFFAFSPKATEFLNSINKHVSATAGGAIEVFPPGDPARNEFLIRLSGLPIGHAIPIDNGNSSTPLFGGIYYEFRRSEDGIYRFRENLEGPFNQTFNPGNLLTSTMPPVPEGVVQELPADPYILGLGNADIRVTTDGRRIHRFSKLFSFPSRAGTALDQAPVELRLPWVTGNGPLDATVKINGQPVGGLAAINDDLCAVEGVDYALNLRGLATLNFAGDSTVVSGEINAGEDTGTEYVAYFEIVIERGPQWWDDPDSFSNTNITWSPYQVVIKATEKDKANDASADNVPKNVGNLNNNNAEVAFTQQSIVAGHINQPFRVSSANATVANQSGAPVEKRIAAGQIGGQTWLQEYDPWSVPFAHKDTVEQLRARGEADGEDLLVGEVITIIDTGKVPLFRYAWGVPPIVSATLGADIWFKALFTYYVFLNFEDFVIDIDALAEPEVSGGIDVFFDLSALFGLVSANVTAAPALGVAMPIVVNDNQLDLDQTVPCFQFVLDLLAQFSIGICPLCIEHGVEERVLEYAKPTACTVGSLNKLLEFTKASSSMQSGTIGVATDGYGSATAVFASNAGIQALPINGGTPGNLQTLETGPGAMRPDAAFFDAGKGLAVWAQSGLSEAAFNAVPDAVYDDPTHCAEGDANCPMTTPVRLPGTEHQHMVYAVLEDQTWGPTMNLTLPTTGEGGVALAGCRGNRPGCPPDGEVLAVWERDTASDIRQHKLKLDYAFFSGATRTWSAVQTIDPPSTAKDVQAEPVFVDGEPMVMWVRNPSATPAALNMQDRELWYEFVRSGAGPREATSLPSAVASPSADVLADGTVVVAFTRSTDSSFIGNRRSLWIARGSNCSAGTCTWSGFEPRDQYNRRMFVEHPSMLVNPFDQITVVGRQVGVDGAFVANESLGIVTGAGDLFRLELNAADLSQGISQSLSNDGAVNWNTSAAFEPTTGTLLAFNAKGAGVDSQPGFQFSKAARRAGYKSGVVSRPVGGVVSKGVTGSATGVFMNSVPWDPDFVLVSAVPETTAPTNRSLNIDVEVQNVGAPTGDDVLVEAWWDGPPGIGTRARRTFINLSQPRNFLTISVSRDRSWGDDEIHELHIILNSQGAIAEADSSNNSIVLKIGAMPVIDDLKPSVDRAGTVAFLDWTAPADSRVAGYRVFRRVFGANEINSVGYSQTNGFVDLNVVPGVTYQYRITTASDRLFESAPSAWVTSTIGAAKKLMVFKDGFESP